VEIPQNLQNLSFRRKPESSHFKTLWTPAFAGVTIPLTFYKGIKIDGLVKSRLNQLLKIIGFCVIFFLF